MSYAHARFHPTGQVESSLCGQMLRQHDEKQIRTTFQGSVRQAWSEVSGWVGLWLRNQKAQLETGEGMAESLSLSGFRSNLRRETHTSSFHPT